MRRLGAWVGPVIAGVSVWCAAGRLTVVSANAATARIVVPASVWWMVAATLVALVVPRWRRDARFALPALLTVLPWLPVPLPAAALVWTGPMAWVPIGLALLASVGGTEARTEGGGRSAQEPRPRAAATAAAVLTVAIASVAAWSASPRVPGGDEPHYLVITQSLLEDGDLRIENNHRNRDYAAYFGGTLAPDFIRRGQNGEIYSIHAPGLPVLVLPAFWIAGYRGAEATMLAVAALVGALVWLVGWRATRDARAAWFAWAAVVGSATFVLQSFQIFPDLPGALVVAASCLLLLRLSTEPDHRVGPAPLVVASALLAALPWLHTRFAILAGGFGLLIVWLLVTDATRPSSARVRRLVVFGVLPVVSAVGWFVFFKVIYGTFSPAAPYGDTSGPGGTHAMYVPGGLAGLLFDEQFGLLACAPVLAVAAIGILARNTPAASVRRVVWGASAVAAVYLVAVATYWMWWAGVPATPARFVTAVLPVFALPLALAWRRARAGLRAVMVVVLAVSLAITALVVGVDRAGLAWNVRDGQARWLGWLGPVVDLARGWPSFFWRLTPGQPTSEWPFGLHILVWLVVLVAAWAVVARLGRRRGWNAAGWRLAAVWWLVAGVTVAVQAGWWLTGSDGLNPAVSQLGVLDAVGGGGAVWRVGAVAIHRVTSADRLVAIRTPEPGRTDEPPPWMALDDVPPGAYELRVVSSGVMTPGDIRLSVGQTPQPFRTFVLQPGSDHTPGFRLPAGAASLVVSGSDPRMEASNHLELVPLRLMARSGPLAQSAMRYGSTNVFFQDDNVFVEGDGFWVRGGQTAAVTFTAGAAQAAVTLALQNGAAANVVTLAGSGVDERMALGPSETRTVALPVPGAGGALALRINSPAGFRPLDVSSSRDTRYLGVRVTVR
jgi:hypothetical protein